MYVYQTIFSPEIHAKLYYLVRWYIKLVLVNATANHILHSDRCAPNSNACIAVQCPKRQTSSVLLFSVYHFNGPVRLDSSSLVRTLPMTLRPHVEQVLELQHFVASSSFLGTSTKSSDRNAFSGLRLNIARKVLPLARFCNLNLLD